MLRQIQWGYSGTGSIQAILMSQHVISIRGIIATALTVAKTTDFIDRPAPIYGPDNKGCIPEYRPI